jgi:hypothetical protein
MDVWLKFCLDLMRRTRMRGDFATRPARLNELRFGEEGRGELGAVTKDRTGEDDGANDAESNCGGRLIGDPGEGGVFSK